LGFECDRGSSTIRLRRLVGAGLVALGIVSTAPSVAGAMRKVRQEKFNACRYNTADNYTYGIVAA
jgi:hypothetical protein